MGILLTILVTIGKILLLLLAVLLLLVLLLLAVPFRYELSGTKQDGKAEGEAGISWLFHAVSLTVRFSKEQKSSWKKSSNLRIFGISPSEIRKKRAQKKQAKQKESKKKRLDRIKEEDPEKYEQLKQEARQRKQKREEEQKEAKKEEQKKTDHGAEQKKAGQMPEKKISQKILYKAAGLIRRFFEGIGHIFTLLYELPAKIAGFAGNTAEKIIRICDTIQIWTAFLTDPRLLEALKLTGIDLKKLWKKIKPKRMEGEVTYGLSNPSVTGKILAAASALFPVYGPDFILHPDFENTRLDGDVKIRGRICLGPVLALAAGYLLNKDVRYVIAFVKEQRNK